MNFYSTQNLILNTHKYVHLKDTYTLGVHQFTSQQVDKGGKRKEFSLNINPNLSTHKHVHSKATYGLRMHQFTYSTASG